MLWVLPLVSGCIGGALPKGAAADVDLANANAAARTAFDRGQTAQAVALYSKALSRARAMDDAGAIADCAYNLAASLMQAGEYTAASTVLVEAEAETRRGHANAADVLLLRAKTASFAGDPAGAAILAGRVLADPASAPTDAHRAQAHVIRGEAALATGALTSARAELSAAQEAVKRTKSPAVQAVVTGLEGQLQLASGNAADAARRFDAQAALLRRAGLYPDMARALARAGSAWLDARRPGPAADRLFRAARAAAAQDRPDDAARLAAWAAVIVPFADDRELQERVNTLRARRVTYEEQ